MLGGRSCHDGAIRSFGRVGATGEGSRRSCPRRLECCQAEPRESIRLLSEVEQASKSAQHKADELQQRGQAAQAKASDRWTEVQSDWARHIETAREQIAAKKAKADAKSAQLDADIAASDAEAAIEFAFAAVEEAEYAVLDATLAQMDADDMTAS